jgi:hypothetical protein
MSRVGKILAGNDLADLRHADAGRPAEAGVKIMFASGVYAVAVRPARSALTCHSRAAAVVS